MTGGVRVAAAGAVVVALLLGPKITKAIPIPTVGRLTSGRGTSPRGIAPSGDFTDDCGEGAGRWSATAPVPETNVRRET
jgi:hypothetical protein